MRDVLKLDDGLEVSIIISLGATLRIDGVRLLLSSIEEVASLRIGVSSDIYYKWILNLLKVKLKDCPKR